MPGKCHFSELWLSEKEFRDWLKPVDNDKFLAYCSLCKKTIDISNSGVFSVRLHAKGKKHVLIACQSLTQPTLNYYTSKPASVSCTVTSEADVTSKPIETLETACYSEKVSEVRTFFLKDDVTKCEIIWTLHKVISHSSARAHSDAADLFPLMFPNDFVAKNMQLGKDKICYMATFGLGPYFQSELLNKLKECTFLALSFDECLNQIVQKCQMDIQIRYWDNETDLVCTRYLSSCFMQKATASDLMAGITGTLASLDVPLKKVIHISMDGPNVNLKMLRELKDHMETTGREDDAQMFNIGTCGLHTVHGAYKTAHNASGWQINHFLRSLYYLFRNTPSRRADYIYHSGSSLFAKKFCSVRWVENSDVLQRAVDMLQPLQKYLHGIGNSAPDSKCFKCVKKNLSDPLLSAKLQFLLSVIKDIEPFLVQFQASEPLLPLLHHALSNLVMYIGERFIKKEFLKAASSDLVAINVDQPKNLVPVAQVGLGIGASNVVMKLGKTSGVNELQILVFKKECLCFLTSIFKKLCEKSPLKYKLVRGASCLSPYVMRSENLRKDRVTLALEVFVEKQHFSAGTADTIKRIYEDLCIAESNAIRAWRKGRLDVFLGGLIKNSNITNQHFIDFVRKLLIIFHGNANVERGFSVNSECLTVGLEEKSLISQRHIYDAVVNAGGIKNLEISKKMINYGRCASSRRRDSIEQKKLEKESEEIGKKKLIKKVQELQEKRKMIVNLKAEELANLDLEVEQIQKKLKK